MRTYHEAHPELANALLARRRAIQDEWAAGRERIAQAIAESSESDT